MSIAWGRPKPDDGAALCGDIVGVTGIDNKKATQNDGHNVSVMFRGYGHPVLDSAIIMALLAIAYAPLLCYGGEKVEGGYVRNGWL